MSSDPPRMPAPKRDSIFGTSPMICRRCGLAAQQVWGVLNGNWAQQGFEDFYDESGAEIRARVDDMGLPRQIAIRWSISHCQNCDQKTLWRGEEVVYPIVSAAPPAHELMPPAVRELYEEAGRVLPVSPRAGAALVRAALELLIKEVDDDAPAGTALDERIARLDRQVSRPLAEMLDVVRHLGNKSLHGGDDNLVVIYLSGGEDAEEISQMLFSTINDLVDELIARPKETNAVWNRLPAAVRESITRKREKAAQSD